jgi:hypothetical protein
MKYTLPLLLLLAGGCAGARTVGPDDFLYAYRCGVMPGTLPDNAEATYTGRDETYHYLELRNGGPQDIFMGELSPTQKLRCRVDQLPASFPSGFEPLRGKGTEGFENGEDTREYVKAYMAKHHDESPASRPPADHSSRRQHEPNDDPRSN